MQERIIKLLLGICILAIIIVAGIEFIPDIDYISNKSKLENQIITYDVNNENEDNNINKKEYAKTQNDNHLEDYEAEYEAEYEYDEEIVLSKDVADKYNISAWVYIDDKISEPIKQGSDNYFYLNHSYDDTYNKYGTAFIDFRQTIDDDDFVIIYGHNVSRGRLFGNLRYFDNKQYCENIQSIMVATAPDFKFKLYKICCVSIVKEDNNIFANTNIKEELENNTIIKLNELEDKQTIILTTCYGKQGTQDRIAVALQER